MSSLSTSQDIPPDEKPTTPPPPALPSASPPPDGGLMAWLQVAAGFVLFFNTWGMINTFSVFQTYYESGQLFHASSSNISWIGSIQCFLLQLTGLVAGPIYDRGHLRLLLITGSFLVVFGLMMLSLCTEFWQALLAQAFCIGIGGGLLFTPTVSLLPTWFKTRLGLAVGIASSGSSLGGIIYPIVLYRLLNQIGFPWAVRTLGFIALATFILPLTVMRTRVHIPTPRALIDRSAFTDAPFLIFTLSVLVLFIANSILIFYISFYPDNRGFTDTSLAFYMAAIFNAGSVFGRIAPNALSDRIGVFNTFAPTTLLLGVTVLCMLAVHNSAGMIVEAIVTGFFSGVVVAMPPVCFRMLTPNPAMIGTRIGQGFAIAGLGLLIGGPTAGAVLGGRDPLDWTGLWVYGGVAGCVAAGIMLGVRVMKGGVAWRVKV
ncbi:monocarboxylate permease-like protein, mch4 [Aspergillus sclerotiicarbonarius CBS 121057]|uniref:Monocarboxylate permease-like protein, mch4 n=1 Tax=Aspergillus sclerotiicarbonarius (strain CBS 121057 / IBT 28362) TaxID=1448318 RepID=A0A319DV03_ASPSB|nr:monocarboxylate permease-like protein, mch4 [Aspergillus sclerotiicarbonarius CBS 121057]